MTQPAKQTKQDKKLEKLPEWHKPEITPTSYRTGLVINNSLTLQKDEFIPENGKHVNFYICGPTVYDWSHLGHARAYLTFDILRRIMSDYFGYEVFWVMNITDIDDKIILRARRNYLFAKYVKEHPKLDDSVAQDLKEAWQVYLDSNEKDRAKKETNLPLVNEGKMKGNKKEMKAEIELLQKRFTAGKKYYDDMLASIEAGTLDLAKTLQESKDQLSLTIDKKEGKTLDPTLVRKLKEEHAAKWELEFLKDLHHLGVREPDVLTRVSEYVPEIKTMTAKIIENGFAYAANGSVYFDTEAFDAHSDHDYAKLEPWSRGDPSAMAESEGKLGSTASDKKNDNDFALWKASKPGEPAWDSDAWGLGRPGWHIECSAMASNVIGKRLDVHAGGKDLKFPHHDNELAQSEAFHCCKQWVNYFIHGGQLQIDGLKMSKSLKNFITIRECVGKFNADQLRMLFLIQSWDGTMNYQRENTMEEPDTKLATIKSFLRETVPTVMRERKGKYLPEKWTKEAFDLQNFLVETKTNIHGFLLKNFDTKSTIEALMKLIKKANVYVNTMGIKDAKSLLLKQVAVYVTKIVKLFGLFQESAEDYSINEGNNDSGNREETLAPVLDLTTAYRTAVRDGVKNKEPPTYFYELSDQLRKDLAGQGVKVVDDDPTRKWNLVNKEALLQELAEQEKARAEAVMKKAKKQLANAKRELATFEKNSIGADAYILQTFQVKMVDGSLPEKKEDGTEIKKKSGKKITASYNKQKKANEKCANKLKEDPKFIETLKARITELSALVGVDDSDKKSLTKK